MGESMTAVEVISDDTTRNNSGQRYGYIVLKCNNNSWKFRFDIDGEIEIDDMYIRNKKQMNDFIICLMYLGGMF